MSWPGGAWPPELRVGAAGVVLSRQGDRVVLTPGNFLDILRKKSWIIRAYFIDIDSNGDWQRALYNFNAQKHESIRQNIGGGGYFLYVLSNQITEGHVPRLPASAHGPTRVWENLRFSTENAVCLVNGIRGRHRLF